MAINFPSSPSLNDTFSSGGVTYTWDGTVWAASGSAAFLVTGEGIDALGDVDTSTVAPTDGQALVWDNTAGQWEPGTTDDISEGTTNLYSQWDDATGGINYSSGNVGIGTTSPFGKLHVQDDTNNLEMFLIGPSTGSSRIRFGDNADTNIGQIIYDNTSDSLQVHANNAERMRIDSSGNVGIGDTSPSSKLSVNGEARAGRNTVQYISLQGSSAYNGVFAVSDPTAPKPAYVAADANSTHLMTGTLGNHPTIFIVNNAERARIHTNGFFGVGATSPIAVVTALGINSGGEGGTMCIQNTGSGLDTSVALYLTPNNGGGNDLVRSASIKSRQEVSGNYANLEFYTSESSTPAERMRISSNGVVRIGQTTSDDPSGSDVQGVAIANGYISAAMDNGNAAVFGRRGSDGSCVLFRRQTTNVGSITVNSSSTAYNTSSDYRLKENVVDITDGITRVKQLAPRRFNFIADADTTVDGFLAHEAQAVVPEAVTGTHNGVDDEGNPVMQGIDQSKLVPLLTAALQEAITKIETLETQNADLLTRVEALEQA